MEMTQQILRKDTNCRLCGSDDIVIILHLNDTPLEDQFVDQSQKDIVQPIYPLDLAICKGCGYVHLPWIINPNASYKEYIYESSVTVGLRNHYDEYAIKIVNDFKITENSLVVDLGSNDGSMLASFKRLGMQVVGVEPATSISNQANERGLKTINSFFSNEIVKEIVESFGKASVVSANYMYANVDNVIEFTENVSKLLSPDGIFIVQTGYHPEQMKIKMFDYIYHEHFSYFTVEVLKNIFYKCGMELIHVQKTAPKGGSVRVVGQLKNGKRIANTSVEKIILEEKNIGIRKIETYQKFSLELTELKNQLIETLMQIKSAGKKIAAFGASHSTTTLLYHFEIANLIEYIVDDNILKQEKYSPGYHLPVYSPNKLLDDKPDYVVILAWQHHGSIMQRHEKYFANGGSWIVPLPQLQLLKS